MKRSIVLTMFLLFTLALGAGALEFVIEDFESLGNMTLGGQNYGPSSKLEIVSSPVKEGQGAAKVTYELQAIDGLSYVELFINKPLPANFGKVRLWVYGNEHGNPVNLRLIDAKGEYFQYRLGNLAPGWQQLEVDLANASGRWGGNNDGILDGPVRAQSIIVDKSPAVTDVVYYDHLVLEVDGGIIKGSVLDPNWDPVEGAWVYLAEEPTIAALTSSNGEFEFICPTGTYTLVVEKSGFEREEIPGLVVAADEIIHQNLTLMWGPDPGVWSDKAEGSESGLTLRIGSGELWRGEIVEIGGRKAVKTNAANKIYYLSYDVDNSYLYDTNEQVWVYVEYYDLGTGLIGLQYHSQASGYTLAGVITRTDTRTWKTARLHLPDARFAGGTNGGDFWIGTWVPGYSAQPDAYIGKVSVMKVGRVLELAANPKVFSPARGAIVEVSYRLSAPAAVSAWVEDSTGRHIATLAEGQDQTVVGTVTWAGRTEQGELVPDGIYMIKLGPVGQAWDEGSILMTTVEVDNSAPNAPAITEPASSVKVNEPRVLITGSASPGALVAVYVDDAKVDEVQADSRGKVICLLENLTAGFNTVTFREVDAAGNESEPSNPLTVNYDPSAGIGQLTVWPQEFNPNLGETEVRFYLAEPLDVKLVLQDGRGRTIAELLPQDVRSGEILYSWDGKAAGEVLADGTYFLKVQGAVTASCQVVVDTTPPQAPVLLLPGTEVSEGAVQFVWEGDSSASQYRLTVWQEGKEEQKQVYTARETTWQLSQALRPGQWLWQVESIDEAGNSSISKVGSFNVTSVMPATLEILNLHVGPNPFAPNGNGRYEELKVGYTLTQGATVTIKIFNLAGKEVYQRSPLPEAAGDHLFTWDGRDRQGRLVGQGAYLLVITASTPDRKAPSRARKLISVLY